VGLDPGPVDICRHGGPQGVCDIPGFHGDSSTAVIVRRDGRRGSGAMKAEMRYAPDGCTNGAAEGIPTATVDHLISTFAVLLSGKGLGHRGSGMQLGR
jgi:hypothetical protein